MADQPETPNAAASESSGNKDTESTVKAKAERRSIPGNLPYTTSAGTLKRALERLPASEKPRVFNNDFLATVLQITGGSARQIPPIFKAVGLINPGGTPNDLYSQFQTEAGRPNAALAALRTGYAEIFRRNQYAHTGLSRQAIYRIRDNPGEAAAALARWQDAKATA